MPDPPDQDLTYHDTLSVHLSHLPFGSVQPVHRRYLTARRINNTIYGAAK